MKGANPARGIPPIGCGSVLSENFRHGCFTFDFLCEYFDALWFKLYEFAGK
ncbi:hypothetical protein SLEP1_g19073 [Rubroshorea leprosula]|nr:hypothetical protein SLEP1_g19073 [Rubroshorea leprosula]